MITNSSSLVRLQQLQNNLGEYGFKLGKQWCTVESLISRLEPSAWMPDTPDTTWVWLTRIQGQDTAETTLPCAPSLLTTQLNICQKEDERVVSSCHPLQANTQRQHSSMSYR